MKKTVFAFLLGVVLTGSIAGVVAYNYNAKDVSYTPNDNNWNVNNVEDAIKDLKNTNNSNIIYHEGTINADSGIQSYRVLHDNDNAMIVSGQNSFSYSINNTDSFVSMSSSALGHNVNNIGLYRKTISVKKDDIIYLKNSTSGAFGYMIIY